MRRLTPGENPLPTISSSSSPGKRLLPHEEHTNRERLTLISPRTVFICFFLSPQPLILSPHEQYRGSDLRPEPTPFSISSRSPAPARSTARLRANSTPSRSKPFSPEASSRRCLTSLSFSTAASAVFFPPPPASGVQARRVFRSGSRTLCKAGRTVYAPLRPF